MAATVRELIAQINETRTQSSASAKNEVDVARAMLNDRSYVVDVYGKSGVIGQYCPSEDARGMVKNILRATTKISSKEATELADTYEFTRGDAQTQVNFSKEFINTYMQTGRKLPLGGREKSNVSLLRKVKEEKENSYPRKVGVNEDGTDKYESVSTGVIPEHESIKVMGGCPSWIKG